MHWPSNNALAVKQCIGRQTMHWPSNNVLAVKQCIGRQTIWLERKATIAVHAHAQTRKRSVASVSAGRTFKVPFEHHTIEGKGEGKA
jgi:hypothetical protein